ncbi:putative Kinase [Quillaja saponaria]|uniref:Kinase n=1 Tax=Quillaja saponaria TaxID=32244 RepID=A0AAD7LYG3_QUISA|nr:putative Kinase [Quillaja saponaria]
MSSDPKGCGDQRYELGCENNVTTVLALYSGRYYVEAIDYNNYTIQVVDPDVYTNQGEATNNCSILIRPRYFLSGFNFSYDDPYQLGGFYLASADPVTYLNCANQVVNDSRYVDAAPCVPKQHSYSYAVVGSLSAEDIKVGCQMNMVAWTSWFADDLGNYSNISYTDIQRALVYGFPLSWIDGVCEHYCGFLIRFRGYAQAWYPYILISIGIHLGATFVLGTPFIIILLICTWRRRHLSMYHTIEEFLQSNNNLVPIRYSYSEIRKMTKGFNDKLGEGGFGSVFKGKLRSGGLVAVKMLGKSRANGQEFISEVATIGRIHHFNVVKLIGYCVEGSKRALVYEFMPNGSLDKYIFPKEESGTPLSIEKMYVISLGVARGIAYLHRGCHMQILHFDIKPHNVLLDENFIPKVSDFGLAKLYPVNHSIVTMTAARGTIGYMAPELFYKNIGGVSYKADVYSFGMLLLEMAGRRKNLNPFVENLSQIYFPSWVYDQLIDGKDIEIGDATEEERKLVKKMIVVALWCIQMKPSDRPSMNKVVEMLEEVECPEMPPKPFLSPEDLPEEDMNTNPAMLSPVSSDDSLESISLIPNAI